MDSAASETMLNSLMYKLSYFRFGELQLDFRSPTGYDRFVGHVRYSPPIRIVIEFVPNVKDNLKLANMNSF